MTHHPDTGLPQRVAMGVLLRSFPPALVDRVLDAADRREQRQRLLPARLMVYFTLGMWIFKALPYEQILAEILRGAPGLAVPAATAETASAAAIGRARRRLGVEPLRLLFEQAAGPSVPPAVASFRGLRPIRMRRMAVGVPATPANLLVFGAPLPPAAATSVLSATYAARSARTPLRAPLSLLIEDSTGRFAAADVADAAESCSVNDRLLAGVAAEGSVLIMDERPLSARIWTTIERFGAEQLWPLADAAQPSSATRLPDGSLLGKLADVDGTELVVRIIPRAYRANRLATSILDHRVASAADLAALYEGHCAGPVFDGLGHGGDTLELRSKDPEMCRQELYAMLCVQHAIGDLIEPIQGIAENGRGRFDAP